MYGTPFVKHFNWRINIRQKFQQNSHGHAKSMGLSSNTLFIVQCNFSETAFMCFVNAKKNLRGFSLTNWSASKKNTAPVGRPYLRK